MPLLGSDVSSSAPAQRSLLRQSLRLFSRDPKAVASAIVLVLLCVVTFGSPWINAYILKQDTESMEIPNFFARPSRQHLLGTDELGRDVLARLLDGGRVSLTVGLLSVVLSAVIGLAIGPTSGYFGGLVDNLLMRFTDTMLCLPTFYLILAVAALTAPSVTNVILLIAFTSWMTTARLMRAEFLAIKERDHVLAARCIGASTFRIMIRHILPNAVSTLIVATTLGVGYAILTESALSFLGVGIQEPQSSWGGMLSYAHHYFLSELRLAVYPGVLISATVLSFNFLGDALREALDPRLLYR